MCKVCGEPLFDSVTKFDLCCGWHSIYDALDREKVVLHEVVSCGIRRIKVPCARCGGRLGHVFPDGPRPTRQRYCVNSVSTWYEETA